MEYENKEAKKLFRWFLLCSVIILVLSATVAMFAVRSYRVKENKAVTAMLGIVLKNDGSDTEESRQEKILECMRMLEHPHAYQKSHQKEIKEAEKILQSYGISEAEPVIAGTKTMERRILLGTLGGVLLAELAAGGLFFIYQKRRSRKLAELSDYMEEIVRGHYELALADNTEDELSHLKNQLYKITLFLKEESDHAKEKKTALAESVADISHQLKTPLTSASILLDNLNENTAYFIITSAVFTNGMCGFASVSAQAFSARSLPADLFHELDDRSYVKTVPAGCGNGCTEKRAVFRQPDAYGGNRSSGNFCGTERRKNPRLRHGSTGAAGGRFGLEPRSGTKHSEKCH